MFSPPPFRTSCRGLLHWDGRKGKVWRCACVGRFCLRFLHLFFFLNLLLSSFARWRCTQRHALLEQSWKDWRRYIEKDDSEGTQSIHDWFALMIDARWTASLVRLKYPSFQASIQHFALGPLLCSPTPRSKCFALRREERTTYLLNWRQVLISSFFLRLAFWASPSPPMQACRRSAIPLFYLARKWSRKKKRTPYLYPFCL